MNRATKTYKAVVVISYLFILIIMFYGCQFSPYAGEVTNFLPAKKDFVGTYRLEKQTRGSELSQDQMTSALIIINSDSTFKATNLPIFADTHYQGSFSYSGKWNTTIVGSTSGHESNDDGTIYGLDLTNMPYNMLEIGFLGRSGPLKLIFTFNDPDQGDVMIFTKIK